MTSNETEQFHNTQDNIDAAFEKRINEARRDLNNSPTFTSLSKDEILEKLERPPVINLPDRARRSARDVAREQVLVLMERAPEVFWRADDIKTFFEVKDEQGNVVSGLLSTGKAVNDLLWAMAEGGKNPEDRVLRRGIRPGAKRAGYYALATGKLWDASIGRSENYQIPSLHNYDGYISERYAKYENAKTMIAKLEKQKPKTDAARATRDERILAFKAELEDAIYGQRRLDRATVERRS